MRAEGQEAENRYTNSKGRWSEEYKNTR